MRLTYFLICIVILSLTGCIGGFDNQIVGDYSFAVANSQQVTILDRSRKPSIVIGPLVVALNHNDKLIAGRVDRPDEKFDLGEVPGYFLIEIASKEIRRGLLKSELDHLLGAHGIDQYELKQPSWTYHGDL